MQPKPIVIIDCFAHSPAVESKLSNCIDRLKRNDLKVMLVTNTPVDKEIAKKLDYLLYDSENVLFDESMKSNPITLIKTLEGMRVFEVVMGMQRHGLSVMRNLFRSLDTARSYGYTHFHRVEVDDLMGEKSLDFLSNVPSTVESNGKRGMFFLNDNEVESNISFHYMYCEIKLFLETVNRIDCQEDYTTYLTEKMGTDTFRNVEEYVRHNINSVIDELLTLDGGQMNTHFSDTIWNTETSQSNLETKYRGCTTRIYRATHAGSNLDFSIVLTYNYGNSGRNRNIELLTNGVKVGDIYHSVKENGWWQTNHIPKSINAIRVIEDGEELYAESIYEIYSGQCIDIL